MASETDICNMALDRIGHQPINAIDEGTKAADLCLRNYPRCRDSLLRAHPWNFAIKRSTLALSATTPNHEFDYQHALPSDCLKVVRTNWEADFTSGVAIYGFPGQHGYATNSVPYRIEGRFLLCNESTAKIEYIAQITDTAQFDELFIDVLAQRLAAEIGMALADNASMVKGLWDIYQAKLNEARVTDAQEGTPREVVDLSPWIVARAQMATKKISELSAAGTLSGTEAVPVVQAGATVRTTAADIANEATALGAFTSGVHTPTTDDGAALGSTGNKWSDLWLASGGVINWNSGNYTITHSAGVLAFSGAATIGTTLGVTGLTTLTGGLIAGVQTLTGPGAVNLTTLTTKLTTTGADALTLADGAEGQLKSIVMIARVGDGTLTPTNLGGATTITFNSVGDSVLLQFLGTDWWVVSNNGATVA